MLKDLVLKNRSYRGFDENRKIRKEEMLDMIDHARICASSVNKQPLVYYIVNELEVVQKIQPYTGWAKALAMELPHEGKCPTAFLLICQDLRIASNPNAYLRDVGIVAQTILLRAAELSLGGCMIGNFQKEKITQILQLDEIYYPHLILAIGKPAEEVVLCDVVNGDSTYYRDEQDRHFVPKRKLEDILISPSLEKKL